VDQTNCQKQSLTSSSRYHELVSSVKQEPGRMEKTFCDIRLLV